MSENKNDNVSFHGKVSKFPKNTKAHKAYNFLENIKVSKKKLWYFIIEKDTVSENGEKDQQLQMIKYNNKKGVNCKDFVNELKNYYQKNEKIKPLVDELIIDEKSNNDFSVIRNIPDEEVDGKKFISIITEDLIKLLK